MTEEVVSIVMVLEPNAELQPSQLTKLSMYLDAHFPYFEVLLIDNGTSLDIENLLSAGKAIRCLHTAKTHFKEEVYSIGIESAIGDYIVFLPSYIEDYSIINESISLICNSSAPTYIIGQQSQKTPKSVLRAFSYKVLLYLSGVRYSAYSSDFRVLNRTHVNLVLNNTLSSSFLFFRIARVGFKPKYIEEKNRRVLNESMFSSIHKFLRLLIDNSNKPLRAVSIIGLTLSILLLFSSLFSFIVLPGNQKIIFFAFFMVSSFLFIGFAIIGEYIFRLQNLIEQKQKDFIVFESLGNKAIETTDLNIEFEGGNNE